MANICTACGSNVVPPQEAFFHEEKIVCARCSISFDTLEQIVALKKDFSQLLSTSKPRASQCAIPNYHVLRFIGTLQEVCGWVAVFISVIVFIITAIGVGIVFAKTSVVTSDWGKNVALLGVFAPSISLLIAGLCMIGLAQLLYCIRDIAQNSFSLRNRFS